jgi:membrane protein DedA with SNARE-associated domain/rhodanese-related sulfurtransferase
MMLLPLASVNDQVGMAVVAAAVFLDQMGVPIPAGPALVVAGAFAMHHLRWGGELLLLATAASVLSDSIWYLAGRRYGNRVMRLLCRLSLTPDSCVNETHARFERSGGKALIIAKFIPGLGVIAPPLAGAMRMNALRFVSLSSIGGTLWVVALLGLGALFQQQILALLPRVVAFGAEAIVAVGALLVGFIGFKWWERRRFYAMLAMARISVEELYALIDSGTAPQLVDVRSHHALALDPRRIPGAVHAPPDDLAAHVGHLSRDQDIVLYCSCPNEATAAQAAKLLINQGFSRVRPLRGGLDAWASAGYPMDLPGQGNQPASAVAA